jgi:flagellar hook-associated protein 3 FlgL
MPFSFSSASLNARRSGDLFVQIKAQMTDLQRQLGTNEKATSYGMLGADRTLSLSLNSRLSSIDGYQDTIQEGQFRLNIMSKTVSRLNEMAKQMKGDVLPHSFIPDATGKTNVQRLAVDRLKEGIDLLNSDINGVRLFGGRATNDNPVLPFEKIIDGDSVAGLAGLKQLIQERKAAELGATNLGRLTLASNPTNTVLAQEAAGLPFGFTITDATDTSAGITTTTAGTPATITIDMTALPKDGDALTINLRTPDNRAVSVTLTARGTVKADEAHTSFTIGATVADTKANLEAALQAGLTHAVYKELLPRAASLASQEFFAGSTNSPPQRVDGVPPETSTGMIAGTTANTLIWYKGDDTAPSARETVALRVDKNQTVAMGAQANEEAFRTAMSQFGLLAAETLPYTIDNEAYYKQLTDTVRSNLVGSPTSQQIDTIGVELSIAATTFKAASERHKSTKLLYQDMLGQIETPKQQEVAAQILSLQTRLEASYRTTSLISKLSLVNYL